MARTRINTPGQRGFSLVELMIVVAIIGILTAIAIPNFQRFQLKSRQSEARNNLAALYTSEKAFFGEWSTYFADFRDIGFRPEGRLLYRVGFGAGGVTAPSNYTGGATLANGTALHIHSEMFCLDAGATCDEYILPGANMVDPNANWITATGATTAVFTAGAIGDIRASSGTDYDAWTINHLKELLSVSNGIDP